MAHQYLAQLPAYLRSAVFGNVGTIIAFRIGAEDGMYLEREYWPSFMAMDLLSLSAYETYLKLSIDGKTREAFSARTLPEPTIQQSHRVAIEELSRLRYGRDRQSVEAIIDSWMADPSNEGKVPLTS